MDITQNGTKTFWFQEIAFHPTDRNIVYATGSRRILRSTDGGKTFASTIQWEGGTVGSGMGYTKLPDDFMRLVVFRMSDWKRPVTDVIQDTNEKYFLQK